MGTKWFRGTIGLGFVAAALIVAGGGQSASAQEELFPLYSVSHQCLSDPGFVGFGGEPGAYDAASCEAIAGFTYVATDANGDEIDACSTEGDQPGCDLLVPYGIDVDVTQLPDGLPAGFSPRENPIAVGVPDGPVSGEAPQANFVNLPVDGVENPPTTEGDGETVTVLPSTGSGPFEPESTASHWLLFGGATVIALANFAVAGRKIAAYATVEQVRNR